MTIKLPRIYVNVPAERVYDRSVPPSLRFTYFLVRGLAYEEKGKKTPPLDWEELIDLLGESRSTIYNHLSELRKRGWLQFASSRYGKLVVLFEDSTHDHDRNLSRNLDEDHIKEEDIDLSDLTSSSFSIPDSDHHTVQKFRQSSGNLDDIDLDPEMKAELLNFGVFEDSLKDVVRKMREGVTKEQIYELMDLCKREGNRPAGLFMHRLKGLQPEHQEVPSRDSRRYIEGKFSDFIDH